MGAAASTQKRSDKKSLIKVIDFVATNYILTQNFQDMRNLAKLDYCNNLVIMTSKIISKHLHEDEIRYLARRIKEGVEVNEMTKEKVAYITKKNLENADEQNETTKRRLCIAIAKHYILIAHIFAAIVTTINPIYVYKDSTGSTVKSTLMQKTNIPKGTKTTIKKLNICSKRLNALLNNQDYNVPNNETIKIKPKFCDMNYDRVRGRDKSLFEEPGIPELEKLYYDDYDDDNGGFKGMTDKMRKEVYEKDVEKFYKAFTGNDSLPLDANNKPTVKKFSQIPLRDFHRSKGCKDNSVYRQTYSGSLKDKLFSDYAEHTRQMMMTAEDNQNKLIEVIDYLFVIATNPETGRKETVINPTLKEGDILQAAAKAREHIVDLYIKCEDDFIKGLELFEAIVEKTMADTSRAQIERLEDTIHSSIAGIKENKPTDIKSTENDIIHEGALSDTSSADVTGKNRIQEIIHDSIDAEQDSSDAAAAADAAASDNADAQKDARKTNSDDAAAAPSDVQIDIPLEQVHAAQHQAIANAVKSSQDSIEKKLLEEQVKRLENENTVQKIASAVVKQQQQLPPVAYSVMRPAYVNPNDGMIIDSDRIGEGGEFTPNTEK